MKAFSLVYNRPDYISPMDDLAFDMYQDPETAQLIRQLEKKKQDAVLRKFDRKCYFCCKLSVDSSNW